MYIIKRDGRKEKVLFDKITARNMKLAADLSVDTISLSQTIIGGLVSGMTTQEIDQLSSESALYRSIYEPDYGVLASRIAWNDLHKNTPNTYRECLDLLYNNLNTTTNTPNPLISKDIYDFAIKHIDIIEKTIDYKKDYEYTYYAYRILQKSYLQKVNGSDHRSPTSGGKTVERGQSMLMRVALGIHGPSKRNFNYTGRKYEGDINKVLDTYKRMSDRYFTHASPTIFSAGTRRPQLSSCYVLSCPDSMGDEIYDEDDNIKDIIKEESIPECWKYCAKISKLGGGIGVDVTCVRPRGSVIGGTNGGKSGGIIPLIKTFNQIARYVDQSGKRKGAISLYLQPWHPDTPEFLECKLKTTNEESAAKDIFPALWIPDIFFERIESDGNWSFFDPSKFPELIDLYGENFKKRYIELELDPKNISRSMKARTLWEKVLKSLDESGLPYMLSKDAANEKSNQKEGNNGEDGKFDNLMSIRGSNLCCEIMEIHTPSRIAVCNLMSVVLSKFVNRENRVDWDKYGETVEVGCENLNMVIDKNYYPIDHCATSNFEYRPIGIGLQGMADAFATLGIPWENENGINPEAKVLNQLFSECMYYHALKKSNELAKMNGPYKLFKNSPTAKGILQFDMWKYSDPQDSNNPLNGTVIIPYSHPNNNIVYNKISNIPANEWNKNKVFSFNIPTYDWDGLKKDIIEHGLFNSLLISPMPTGTTSQILNQNECFEVFTSNIYARKGIAGDSPAVNIHLYRDLVKINKWNKKLVNEILNDGGSVKNLDIPQHLKNVYKTVWEISQRTVIDFAADRGAFIDQSQSMNVYLERPTASKLSSMYIYSWKKGLKTLSYYLRSTASVDPVKFNIMDENDHIKKIKETMNDSGEKDTVDENMTCARGGGSCSS